MTDLQKDQAIYQAMCEIAEQVFNETMQSSEVLPTLIKQYGGFVTLSDLCKPNHEFTNRFYMSVRETQSGKTVHEVNVDTFSCSFPGGQVFDLLKYWKSLANIKNDQVFFYEEKVDNDFAGSVEVNIDDSNNAKLLVKHCGKDELRPIMNGVLAEINATTQTVNFVATNGHSLGVISSNPAEILHRASTDTIFQAMFMPDDWKRICDFAKKNSNVVQFDIYRKKGEELFDTFLVHLGDVTLRSAIHFYHCYPNWQSVIPTPDRLKHRFSIVEEDRKAAQDWLKSIKDKQRNVNVSFYRGSDLVYFDYDDCDFSKSMTATFRLTRPSDTTIGVAYNIGRLQQIKFTGFNIEASDRASIVDSEEADLMLVMPSLSNSYVRDVENREVRLQVWAGCFAGWETANGDFANVRVEAVNTENGTATIRTKGWNRYKVDIDTLRWNYCEEYTFPSWVAVGQFIQSETFSGTITDVSRTYVTLDSHRLVSYKDLFASYSPVAQPIEVTEMQAA